MQNYYYSLLVLSLFLLAVIYSIARKISFKKVLTIGIPGIIFSTTVMGIIDSRLLSAGILALNQKYITNIIFFNIPIERWAYYIALSILSLLAFEDQEIKPHNRKIDNQYLVVALILLVVFAVITYIFRTSLYTFFMLFLLSIYWAYTIFRGQFKPILKPFFTVYVMMIIPFIIYQLIITQIPIIQYNPIHIIGAKISSVPIETLFFLYLLMLINITIYNYLIANRIFSRNKNLPQR